MEYRRFGDKIVLRMNVGEEVLEQVKEVSLKENIKLAQVTAIGATNDFTVGAFDIEKQEYFKNTYTGQWEITSLVGNINTMNGEFYTHLHMNAADKSGNAVGGHLNRAVISATCEMIITIIDGEVDRVKDEKTGINIFKF